MDWENIDFDYRRHRIRDDFFVPPYFYYRAETLYVYKCTKQAMKGTKQNKKRKRKQEKLSSRGEMTKFQLVVKSER